MFEIDYIGLIVSMVLMAAFIAPIYLNVRKNNKKLRDLLRTFDQLALEKGLVIQEKDNWRNRYIIGLDPVAKKLLYLCDSGERQVIVVDLQQLQLVKLHEQSHQVGKGKDSYQIADLLVLQLYLQNQATISLTYYDGDQFSDLHNEKPLILKWQKLLAPMAVAQPAEKKQPISA